jgi:alpha-tubulin suppressor-like RCC1 family protein
MLAFGTDYEYYNAVWVKNEWSRFLKLMEKDKSKHLIPCYKGIDAYDMPKEFHLLQGQDMGKVGAVQDLLRGIEKILPKKAEKSQPVVQQVIQAGGPNVTAQLKRGFLALEDGNWEVAQSYFDKALDMDAESADAYLGTALSKQALHSETEISALGQRDRIAALESDTDYQKFLRFAPEERKTALDALLAQAKAATSERERREAEEQRRKAEELSREAEEREKRKPILAAARERLNPCRGMIAAGIDFTVGLRAVGSVLAVGSNSFGQCSVNDWTNIVAVSAGFMHAVGLRADGTVLAIGTNNSGQCSVNDWRNIVAIDAGDYHTVGLHTDGSALAVGSNSSGQCNIGDWKDIISIAAGSYHTVGLRADGSVLAVGSNEDGQCNVGRWKDIVAVAAGICHTVGLNADGSVLAVGSNGNGRSDVDGWTGIAAVTAGSLHTVGFRADGTVLAVGDNRQGQCDVGDWKLFNNLDTLDQERKDAVIHAEQERKEMAERAERKRKEATERKRKEAAERAEQERREAAEAIERVRQAKRAALTSEKSTLQTELANLKGIFSGKRRKEIEARLTEIEGEQKKLI